MRSSSDLLEEFGELLLVVLADGVRVEADGLAADAVGDEVLDAVEGAPADEEDVRGVHRDVRLLGMLAAALRRHVGDGAFEHFEQGLLDAFSGDVAGDGDVHEGLADFVNLVNVNDALLGAADVHVGVLQELEEHVLDVLADVAGLGEGGGVGDGEGDVEDFGQDAREERLAGAGGAHEQDVGLLDLDAALVVIALDAFVVVVDGDGEDLFGALLADDVFVELRFDLDGSGDVLHGGPAALAAARVGLEDVLAAVNALVADEKVARSADEDADGGGAAAAEGAGFRRRFFAGLLVAHGVFPAAAKTREERAMRRRRPAFSRPLLRGRNYFGLSVVSTSSTRPYALASCAPM